jgi:hypothetical protein
VGSTTQRSGHERATPGCRARHRMRTAPAAPRHALASGAFSPFFALCPADHHGHSLILRLRAERRPDVAPARLARPAAAREARPSCTCSSSSSSSNHIRRQAAPSCSALGSPIPVARSRLLVEVWRTTTASRDLSSPSGWQKPAAPPCWAAGHCLAVRRRGLGDVEARDGLLSGVQAAGRARAIGGASGGAKVVLQGRHGGVARSGSSISRARPPLSE